MSRNRKKQRRNKRLGKPKMGWLDKIAATKIEASHLWRANEAIARKRHQIDTELSEDRFLARFMSINGELSGELSRAQLTAVWFRMQALAELVAVGALQKWALGAADDGGVLIPEAIFQAAASAKLTFNEAASFNPEEVRCLALEFSEVEGRA